MLRQDLPRDHADGKPDQKWQGDDVIKVSQHWDEIGNEIDR